MRYTFTFIILLIFIASSYSQNQDSISFNDEIRNTISDSSSMYYYPKLLIKLNQKPSELKIPDVYYLYYGQIFQSDYKYFGYMADDNQGPFRKAVMRNNCKKAISSGINLISKFPLDLTTLLHLKVCMKNENMADTTYFFNLRFRLLLDAILNTGDGKSYASAIKVINIEHESIIKGAICFLGGTTYMSGKPNHAYDIWEVGDKKLYFDLVMNSKK